MPDGGGPKKVVYLLGAGATQAEVDSQGGEKINMLMNGISTRILQKTGTEKRLELPDSPIDIEKLISLLANTGIKEYEDEANLLRKSYFKEIRDGLSKTGVLYEPKLAITLLEMHKNKEFNDKLEVLSGIISLNHDNLFQTAMNEVYCGLNLGFKYYSDNYKIDANKEIPILIHLHGAFNWRNSLPIRINILKSNTRFMKDAIWIPPTILKESKNYPYNKLMGLAYELLSKKCDVLRVVGCSLSQNDWNLISLLFNAQSYQYEYNKKQSFRIELIMDHETGEKIKKEHAQLKELFTIVDLEDGNFKVFLQEERKKLPRDSEVNNPFKFWIKEFVRHHNQKNGIKFEKSTDTFDEVVGPRAL